MFEAIFMSQLCKSFVADAHSAAVAPDDGRTQYLLILIYTYQSVHLVGNAYTSYGFAVKGMLLLQQAGSMLYFLPLALGVLFGPASLRRLHRHFLRRARSACYTFAAGYIQQTGFYGRRPDIVTK